MSAGCSPFSIRRKNEVCDVMQFREFRGASPPGREGLHLDAAAFPGPLPSFSPRQSRSNRGRAERYSANASADDAVSSSYQSFVGTHSRSGTIAIQVEISVPVPNEDCNRLRDTTVT